METQRDIEEKEEIKDIILIWDNLFKCYLVTAKTQKGKDFLYKYNKKLHKKITLVTKSLLSEFESNLKNQGLSYKILLEEIFVNDITKKI